ncbi:MAG: substrate-binding domain-containing protein [Bacillota bacterium]
MKKMAVLSLCLLLILSVMAGCAKPEPQTPETPVTEEPKVENSSIIMATTTSTENSGLLDYLLPVFQEDTGIEAKVVAVGTGQALKMGEDGEADVLLVHAKSSEEEFVKAGHGLERFDVMYNDFVLIGPKEDTLNLKETAAADIAKALTLISEKQGKFVSRGDDSGTHKAELKLWKAAGIEPTGEWYVSAGKGMGDTIQMANEMLGYTLSDRATYLSMKDKLDLEIVVEGDTKLFNQYGVIAVNPNKNDKINHEGAQKFVEWILSEKGQKLIGEFGKAEFGEPLFIPNAK